MRKQSLDPRDAGVDWSLAEAQVASNLKRGSGIKDQDCCYCWAEEETGGINR